MLFKYVFIEKKINKDCELGVVYIVFCIKCYLLLLYWREFNKISIIY